LYATYQVRRERRNLMNDLARTAATLADNLQREVLDSSPSASSKANIRNLQRIAERAGHHEHLLGVAVYDQDGKALALTPGLDPLFNARPQSASRAARESSGTSEYFVSSDVPLYIYAVPLRSSTDSGGSLAV